MLALAFLAKTVAVLAILPVVLMLGERRERGGALRPVPIAAIVVVPLAILALYDWRIGSYAEWHWASGITRLHVLPALRDALTSGSALANKLVNFRIVLGLLRDRLLGRDLFRSDRRGACSFGMDPAREAVRCFGRGWPRLRSTSSSS